MPAIPLPRTAGCVVCSPHNPHGLHLTSTIDPATGAVRLPFTPGPHHIGFDGLVHGGVLATVVDEAMVWAAIWASRRSCVAGEMSVRFRRPTAPGDVLTITATVVRVKRNLIEAAATITLGDAEVMTATGKYLAGTADQTAAFLATLLPGDAALPSVAHLRPTP